MAQKKKKGKSPQDMQKKHKKLSVTMIIFYAFSVVIVLSMILPLLFR